MHEKKLYKYVKDELSKLHVKVIENNITSLDWVINGLCYFYTVAYGVVPSFDKVDEISEKLRQEIKKIIKSENRKE